MAPFERTGSVDSLPRPAEPEPPRATRNFCPARSHRRQFREHVSARAIQHIAHYPRRHMVRQFVQRRKILRQQLERPGVQPGSVFQSFAPLSGDCRFHLGIISS